MRNFLWRCVRESKFTELLLSSISYTLSSKGYLVGRALSSKTSLLLLIVLASERASVSPLVSCSLLVERIHESRRSESVLQQEENLGTPQLSWGSLCPNLHPEETGFASKILFSSVICTTNRREEIFLNENVSNSILHYLSPITPLNDPKSLKCFSVLLWHILKTSILLFLPFKIPKDTSICPSIP